MALINCPECGKEISDSIDTCIHCGVKLKNNPSTKKSKTIITIAICVALILIGVITAILVNNQLTEKKNQQLEQQRIEEEQQRIEEEKEKARLNHMETVTYYSVMDIKNVLKNPESLQIHSLKCCPRYNEFSEEILEVENHEFFVEIDFSAQNGFGGLKRDTYYITVDDTTHPFTIKSNATSQIMYNEDDAVVIDVSRIEFAMENPEAVTE